MVSAWRAPERILPDKGDFDPEEMRGERLPSSEEVEARFNALGFKKGDIVVSTHDPERQLKIVSFNVWHRDRKPSEIYMITEQVIGFGGKRIYLEEVERKLIIKKS